jgi:hypothetical protein
MYFEKSSRSFVERCRAQFALFHHSKLFQQRMRQCARKVLRTRANLVGGVSRPCMGAMRESCAWYNAAATQETQQRRTRLLALSEPLPRHAVAYRTPRDYKTRVDGRHSWSAALLSHQPADGVFPTGWRRTEILTRLPPGRIVGPSMYAYWRMRGCSANSDCYRQVSGMCLKPACRGKKLHL